MKTPHSLIAATLLAATALTAPAVAAPILLATGTLPLATDLAGRTDTLENGNSQSVFGGIGSGLAYAGGNTFLATPDRGPNAVSYNAQIDNTTSYISRFETVQVALAPNGGAGLPFILTPTLAATTLLYSTAPLNYGSGAGLGTTSAGAALPSGSAVNTTAGKYYFTGRSDNFGTTYGTGTGSANQQNARFDPESIRVSPDGKSVFISDEYGPYIYQFDRATGERIRAYTLPANVTVANQSPVGVNEEAGQVPGNTSGRTDNKGMEGLALTPDGKTLVGILQAPTVQDGTASNLVRIVTVDVATGATHEYGYKLNSSGVSDIVALNDHQFVVDERDGKGLGDGSTAAFKRAYLIDIAGATDITTLNAADALNVAVSKTQVFDLVSLLGASPLGLAPNRIPAKIEGYAFGADVLYQGTNYHTLYIANDNDFLPNATLSNGSSVANPSLFYVIGLDDAYLASLGVTAFGAQAVPEPASLALLLPALGGAALLARRRSAPTSA